MMYDCDLFWKKREENMAMEGGKYWDKDCQLEASSSASVKWLIVGDRKWKYFSYICNWILKISSNVFKKRKF